jgi:hypothetical protein
MAFKDIHKLKKIVEVQKEFIEVDHVVVGKDAFAIGLYDKLANQFGSEAVKLISEDKILKNDLFFKGPNTVRGEDNFKVINDHFSDAIIGMNDRPSVFYKDMVFKLFAGRSKPEVLKYDEAFYIAQSLEIDTDKLFPFLNNEKFLDQINNVAYQVKLKNIHFKENHFLIECINGTEFKAKKLYFGKSPSKFLDLFFEKSILNNEFIQFCESTKTVHGLFMKYIFEMPLTDMKETIFIPLSYTHDWGHFVGEFKNQENKQAVEFLHYVDEDHISEEDISRIIRQLKKSFEKIFENFNKIKFSEFISIEDELGCLEIDDQLYARVSESAPTFFKDLIFIGKNAPIKGTRCGEGSFEYSKEKISHLSRALVSYKIALNNI